MNYDYDQIDNVTNTKAVIVQYECDQCKYKTTTLVELTRQIQLDHVKYDYYQNECNQCKYKTTTIVDFTSHIMSELGEVKYDNDHSNNVNTDNTSVKYECELSTIEDWNKLFLIVQCFGCDICGKTFKMKYDLRKYMSNHDGNVYTKMFGVHNGQICTHRPSVLGLCVSQLFKDVQNYLIREIVISDHISINSDSVRFW